MSKIEQIMLDIALRRDFGLFLHRCFITLNPGAEFHPNWHIEAISYLLDQVSAGRWTRIILNLPPRHLKSTIVSVAFVAFVLGHDPTKRIFVVSYANELSFKHARDFPEGRSRAS